MENLWGAAEQTFPEERQDLGPLTATFLLSMSMPIINLPVERMERHKEPEKEGYADDRFLNPRLVAEINRCLGDGPIQQADFFVPGRWSFAKIPPPPEFNIARGLPRNLTDSLRSNRATMAAGKLSQSEWCSILRNSLAHGGVAYLAENGHSTPDAPVAFYAFVNPKYGDYRQKKPEAYRVLRISIGDYREFLHRWVRWLQLSGIADAVADAA